jgi:hypothetical protein
MPGANLVNVPAEGFMIVMRSAVTLSAEELQAVGCVAVESAYLELALEEILRLVSGLDRATFRAVAGRTSLSSLTTSLGELLKRLGDPSVATEAAALIMALEEATRARNLVIHGEWSVPRIVGRPRKGDDRFDWIREGPASARPRKRGKTIDASEVMAVARELARLTVEVLRAPGRFGLLPPSRSAAK